MALQETSVRRGVYVEELYSLVRIRMKNILRHQLGLPATALQEHGDADLHIMSALVSLGDKSSAEEIAQDPNLVRRQPEQISQALREALVR